jgi:hypothetical protein
MAESTNKSVTEQLKLYEYNLLLSAATRESAGHNAKIGVNSCRVQLQPLLLSHNPLLRCGLSIMGFKL